MTTYPSEPVAVLAFRYRDDLHLTRRIEAVKGRRSEDADYVVVATYRATVAVRSLAGGRTYDIPVRVPERFLTDLSSVPWWGRWYVGRVGPHLEASVVHDWLYAAWRVQGRRHRTERNRKFADDVFRAAMIAARTGRFRRAVVYRAVRWFGWCAFYLTKPASPVLLRTRGRRAPWRGRVRSRRSRGRAARPGWRGCPG